MSADLRGVGMLITDKTATHPMVNYWIAITNGTFKKTITQLNKDIEDQLEGYFLTSRDPEDLDEH